MRHAVPALVALASIVVARGALASPSLAEQLDASKECGTKSCIFRAGKDLRFSISGLGKPNAGIVFDKSNIDGDYYASFGLLHNCVIVHNGNARPPIVTEIAFVSPRSGKVYKSWEECKDK